MRAGRVLRGTAVLGMAGVVVAGVIGTAPDRGGRPKSEPGAPPPAPSAAIKGWQKGKGWGWVWGKNDEVGALNAMTDASRAAALALAKKGEVFDLGLTYSRRSYKWPGHSPGEILTFRSPDGLRRMKDPDYPPDAT